MRACMHTYITYHLPSKGPFLAPRTPRVCRQLRSRRSRAKHPFFELHRHTYSRHQIFGPCSRQRRRLLSRREGEGYHEVKYPKTIVPLTGIDHVFLYRAYNTSVTNKNAYGMMNDDMYVSLESDFNNSQSTHAYIHTSTY